MRAFSAAHPALVDLLGACRRGDIDGMRAALADGANVNGYLTIAQRAQLPDALGVAALCSPLEVAALSGHIEACAFLLERGANINGALDCLAEGARWPLLHAMQHGTAQTVRFLVGRDPSPEHPRVVAAMEWLARGAAS